MHLLERRALTLVTILLASTAVLLSFVATWAEALPADRISGGDGWCAILAAGGPTCHSGYIFADSIPSDLGEIKQISMDDNFACGVRTDGQVRCWGPGAGDYETPGDLGPVKQVSVDGWARCAIRDDNTPRCWGSNIHWQLNIPGDIGTVSQISVGGDNVCAVETDGTPVCWGKDSFGYGDNIVPEGIGKVLKIVSGGGFNCAIKVNGKLQCWGRNNLYQTTNPVGTAGYADVHAGSVTACAVEVSGVARCWGNGSLDPNASAGPYTSIMTSGANPTYCGALVSGPISCWGNRSTHGDVYGADPAAISKPVQVSAGWNHSCAVKSTTGILCWGDNSQQELFPGNSGLSPSLAFREVAAGGYYTCAIRDDATLSCWGKSDAYGPLPEGIGRVRSVSVGNVAACAIKEDNTPVCWSAVNAAQTTLPEAIGTVTQVSSGASHSCAIKTDGTPVCWGSNANLESSIPVGVNQAIAVSAGDRHSCLIKTDGTPLCWGLGYPGTADLSNILAMKFESIASGHRHDCGTRVTGEEVCWGPNPATFNDLGQASPPTTLGPAIQQSTGSAHTCAVNGAGRVGCWGNNNNGQGARGATITSSSPPAQNNGSSYSHTFTASSLPELTAKFRVTAGALPPGLSLDASTGALTGTPTEDGIYNVTVKADDGFFAPDAGQSFSIEVDSVAPVAPSGLAFDRTSPSSGQTVGVYGQAEAGSTVSLYASPDCSGTPVRTGTALHFGSGFVINALPADGTTSFSADARDNVGNKSPCSAEAVTFVTDNTAPDAPSELSTDPASPAASLVPKLSGVAEAGSTVQIYRTTDCSGDFDEFDAEQFADGVSVSVTTDGSVSFSATANDLAGNLSSCSAPLTYTHVTPPDPTGPTGEGPTGSTGPSGPGDPTLPQEDIALTSVTFTKTCLGRKRGAARRTGLRFSINQSAKVKLSLQAKKVSKKKIPRKCVKKLKPGGKYGQVKIKKSRKSKKARSLTKTYTLAAGAHSYDIFKAFKIKSLKPGLYRVVVSATDAGGKTAKVNAYLVSPR